MSEHFYIVTPMLELYETRHKAVGVTALFDRDFTSSDTLIVPVDLRFIHNNGEQVDVEGYVSTTQRSGGQGKPDSWGFRYRFPANETGPATTSTPCLTSLTPVKSQTSSSNTTRTVVSVHGD